MKLVFEQRRIIYLVLISLNEFASSIHCHRITTSLITILHQNCVEIHVAVRQMDVCKLHREWVKKAGLFGDISYFFHETILEDILIKTIPTNLVYYSIFHLVFSIFHFFFFINCSGKFIIYPIIVFENCIDPGNFLRGALGMNEIKLKHDE